MKRTLVLAFLSACGSPEASVDTAATIDPTAVDTAPDTMDSYVPPLSDTATQPEPSFVGRTLDETAAAGWILGPAEVDGFGCLVEFLGEAVDGRQPYAMSTEVGSTNSDDIFVYVAEGLVNGATEAASYPRIVVPTSSDYEPHTSDLLGIVAPGDLDGDGSPDLVLHASGVPEIGYAFPSAFAGELWLGDAFATFSITGLTGATLRFQPAGDIDGEGGADLAIAHGSNADLAHQGGAIYLLAGPFAPGAYDTDEAYATLRGAVRDGVLGAYGVEGVDHDGDGADDLVIGGGDPDGDWQPQGGYVVQGPVIGDLTLPTDADVEIDVDEIPSDIVAADEDALLRVLTLRSVGDLDGDGHHDLLLGPYFLLPGAVTGVVDAAVDASAVILPPTSGHFDLEPAGDIDGDGFGDLAGGTSLGGHVLYGPFLGTVDARQIGDRLSPHGFGGAVEGVTDLNGDGKDDLMMTGAEDELPEQGAVYLFLGGF